MNVVASARRILRGDRSETEAPLPHTTVADPGGADDEPAVATLADPVAVARAEVADVEGQIRAKQASIARIRQTAAGALAAAGAVQALQAQREALLSQQLESGAVDLGAAEIVEIDAQLAAARTEAARFDGAGAAAQASISRLEGEYLSLVQQLRERRRALELAQFGALSAHITDELVPRVRRAAEALGRELAALNGAGIASHQLAEQLRQQGESPQPLGGPYPSRRIDLTIGGFGFGDLGAYNLLHVDIGQAIDEAHAATLSRFTG